jgi:hypothetical protein
MSASSVDPFDLAEQLARIRRMQEESHKFSAEQHKLTEEALKFAAEQRKLTEEALKFRRDRFVAPVVAFAALLGGLGGLVTLIQWASRIGGHP